MKLSRYNLEESIFVDANIFTFHFTNHTDFGKISTNFLQKIESHKIKAVSSDIVLNEVLYITLLHKGLQLLKTESRWEVREKFDKDSSFADECYQGVQEVIDYIMLLETSGLTIVGTGPDLLIKSIEVGKKYRLWTRDAIHAATCQALDISHIATHDKHFAVVDFLKLWEP